MTVEEETEVLVVEDPHQATSATGAADLAIGKSSFFVLFITRLSCLASFSLDDD